MQPYEQTRSLQEMWLFGIMSSLTGNKIITSTKSQSLLKLRSICLVYCVILVREENRIFLIGKKVKTHPLEALIIHACKKEDEEKRLLTGVPSEALRRWLKQGFFTFSLCFFYRQLDETALLTHNISYWEHIIGK